MVNILSVSMGNGYCKSAHLSFLMHSYNIIRLLFCWTAEKAGTVCCLSLHVCSCCPASSYGNAVFGIILPAGLRLVFAVLD